MTTFSLSSYKRNANFHRWEIHFGRFEQILLRNCFEHGQLLTIQNKSECERNKKHPTASSVPIRLWSTHQNWFSPRNGREISFSVFDQTRLGQLYLTESVRGCEKVSWKIQNWNQIWTPACLAVVAESKLIQTFNIFAPLLAKSMFAKARCEAKIGN